VKQYPSIGRDNVKGQPFYVFDKLDGSNVRAEWNPKKGFWKFGSRTQLLDLQSSPLGALTIPLMKAQEDQIGSILRGLRAQEATCFFEFYGPSSFAGVHQWKELNFQAVLFDVTLFKRGFMQPGEFVKTFAHKVSIPSLLHYGNVSDAIVRQVWDGTLPGMTFEGVVCKGTPLKNGYPPHMFKLKSKAWIEKVKSLYTDPKKLEELL
jgi:hypothetical protein